MAAGFGPSPLPIMEQALLAALHARLSTEAGELTGLASYRDQPAVFTDTRVPSDAKLPYVHVRPQIAAEPFKTLRRDGARATVDVAVYAEDGDSPLLRTLAYTVRDLLDTPHLNVAGWDVALVRVTGPVGADDEQGYAGRVVTLTAWLKKL